MSRDVYRVERLIDHKYSETPYLLKQGPIDPNSLTECSTWDFALQVPR